MNSYIPLWMPFALILLVSAGAIVWAYFTDEIEIDEDEQQWP